MAKGRSLPQYRWYRPDLGGDLFSLMRRNRGFFYDEALEADDGGGEGAVRSVRSVRSLFWPGCTLTSYSQELTEAVFEHLKKRGIVDGMSARCCGNIVRHAGGQAAYDAYRDSLIAALDAKGVQRIVTACPTCYFSFHGREGLPSRIEVIGLARLLADEGLRVAAEQVAPACSVCVHDSCPDRASGSDAAAVRTILEEVETREMRHNRSHSRCCGLGKLRFISDPAGSERQRRERIEEFRQTEAEQLVTYCFSCANAFQQPDEGIRAVHYLELLFNIRVDWPAVYASTPLLVEPQNSD